MFSVKLICKQDSTRVYVLVKISLFLTEKEMIQLRINQKSICMEKRVNKKEIFLIEIVLVAVSHS